MTKNILIFSDGTGQMGGLRPDQRLSNIYKMYRAMRPGPTSSILPSKQIAFYDPGLGAAEVRGIRRRVANTLEAAVGSGIDDNVIDCYEHILKHYVPGDRVMLFGFSRGAYTVRAVSNVMNLCGVPTHMPDGSLVPRYGKALRSIAKEAVINVYNHGAGKDRNHKIYGSQREELGKRFRKKYGSAPPSPARDVQGNVQPDFIGAFDSVAALGTSSITILLRSIVVFTLFAFLLNMLVFRSQLLTLISTALIVTFAFWWIKSFYYKIKIFSPNSEQPLKLYRPADWGKILDNVHLASWKKKNYDGWLDSDVGYARHALAIDEQRANFPRVKWCSQSQMDKNAGKKPEWFRQVWFAGCHSDIGGSYSEDESRLSDIALDWMVRELKDCFPGVEIRDDLLVRAPDPRSLQHEETYFIDWGPLKKKWKVKPRKLYTGYVLHPSVLERFAAEAVPQVGEVKPYRPVQLAEHDDVAQYFT